MSSTSYDAIVIGSGLAGLSAALTLLIKNKKVLILERHNVPGGCASSFVRGRFEFETSLHELCGIGTPEHRGSIGKRLDNYGVKVDWVNIPDCYRLLGTYTDGGMCDKVFPVGKEAFTQAVISECPEAKEAMAEFWRVIEVCQEGLDYVQSPDMDSTILIKSYPDFLIYGSMNSLQAFKKMGMPVRAIDIMSAYWSYLGVPLDKMNFMLYGMMISLYISEGAVIPKNTSHELSSGMVRRVQELGGTIIYGKEVTKILFENDRIAGVECGDEKYFAPNVVANVNPHVLYGKLMPENKVTLRQKKLCSMREKHFGGYLYQIYMGLNKDAAALGIRDYSIMMPEYMDSVKEYKASQNYDKNAYEIAVCPNVVNPAASEPGTCILTITGLASEKMLDMEEKDYFKFKQMLAADKIAKFERLTGIEIQPYIEEIEVATPVTVARYIATPNGVCYGYETRGADSMMARIMSMKEDLDIPGLYPVSAASIRGDGYSSTIAAGNVIASLIK